jgi:DNA-binding HxlR family transcriptional regulator
MSRNCPVFLTLQLIAHKWSVRILRNLLHAEENTLRFGQLQKGLEGITQRELTKHLREFEKAGIVERTVYAEVPPRVEYRLTRTGHSLLKPVEEISVWAEKNAAFVQRKRQEFALKGARDQRRPRARAAAELQ